ncbi:MAG: trypsin-like peptidase domain-containing protein [Rhodomicrobium sp.]
MPRTWEDAIAAQRKGDNKTAFKLFRQLAEKGDTAAQYNLGYMYITGQGVIQDNMEAAKWFKLAADKGLARAQHIYGLMCASGERLPQDHTEAAKWFRLSAEQGEAGAQSSLGVAYASGQGVPQNYIEAAKWFRLAANQGDAEAQFRLGLLYFVGFGVPQNYINAHMWLSLAAAQGHKNGETQRNSVAQRMTSLQIAEAQKIASEWRPKSANTLPPRIAAQTSPSRQRSEIAATSGTAFFVSPNGEALTNAHVVEGCKQIHVGDAAARLLARDAANDLALLATDLHPAQWAKWRSAVRQGEDIVVYGFPLAGVLSSSGNVVTGNVTALAGLGDDSRFLQISAPLQPGNSGGPLFDRNGDVAGVVVSKLNAVKIASITGDIPQNVNFAIKASVAFAFLDVQRVAHTVGGNTNPLSTPNIASQGQALTAQVVCFR